VNTIAARVVSVRRPIEREYMSNPRDFSMILRIVPEMAPRPHASAATTVPRVHPAEF
jgi:hypothetical protein